MLTYGTYDYDESFRRNRVTGSRTEQLFKTDALGHTRISEAQREAILDALNQLYEPQGMLRYARIVSDINEDPYVHPFPQPALGLFVLWGGWDPRVGATRTNPGL